MVTVYSGQAAAASGKRTSLLPVNRESGAALASGFLGEYPIHPASAGRAEGHREGCAPGPAAGQSVCSARDASSTPARRAPPGPWLRRAGRRRAGPPLVASTLTHCPVIFRCPHPPADRPLVPGGAGRPPSWCGPPISTHPPLKGCLASPSQRGQQGAGCGGWTAWVQGTEATPGSPGTEMAKPLTG